MRSSGEPKATATKGEDLMGGPKGVFVGGQLINIFWMKYLLVSPTVTSWGSLQFYVLYWS